MKTCFLLLTLTTPLLFSQEPLMNAFTSEGFIPRWLHVGPLPTTRLDTRAPSGALMSAFHTDFLGGEAEARLKPGQAVQLSDGSTLIPQPLEISPKGWNKGSVGGRTGAGTAHYFYTEVTLEQEEERFLYADFEGSPVVWINGKELIRNWRDVHILKRYDYGVPVSLKAGTNRILVKVDSLQTWWLARLEFLTPEQYGSQVLPAVQEMKVVHLDETRMKIDTIPATFNGEISFTASLFGANGRLLGVASGKAGETVQVLRAPQHPWVDGQVVWVELRSPELPDLSERILAIDGSPLASMTSLQASWPDAKKKAAALPAPWPGVYKASAGWIERRLKSDVPEGGPTGLESLYYMQQVTQGLLQGANPLQELKGVRIPAWFTWTDSQGTERVANYGVTLPRRSPLPELPPVLYSLRGGSFRDQEVGVSMEGFQQEEARYDVDKSESLDDQWLSVTPANLGAVWDPEMLEAIHQHLTDHLPHDSQRVYVTGGSLGGMGGWGWVAHNPKRFAAAILRAGLGDVALAPRAAQTPIWLMCGGRDSLVYNVERGFQLLQEEDGIARYTLFPLNGHGGGGGGISNEIKREWLLSHTLRKDRRKDIDLNSHYGADEQGMGSVHMVTTPAGTSLTLPVSGSPLNAPRGSYKTTFRLVQGYRLHGNHASDPITWIPHAEGQAGQLEFKADRVLDPTLIPEGVTLNESPAFRALSLRYYGPKDGLEAAEQILRTHAKENDLDPAAPIRWVLHSITTRNHDKVLVELQLPLASVSE